MFIFEDNNGELYDSPDSYILSLPRKTIDWGDQLKIHPVYNKGSPIYHGYQIIQAMFFHEGSTSSLDGTYWYPPEKENIYWYGLINHGENIKKVNTGSVIKFDLGIGFPKYFQSVTDLSWYIGNIYPLTKIQITDEFSL